MPSSSPPKAFFEWPCPQTLAALRNAALTIHRRRGNRPVEGQEHFAEHRYEALAVLKQTRTE